MAPKRTSTCISAQEDENLLKLRHYELGAYSAVVTALRAEGPLNEEKKTVLKQLQHILGISVERHKAEVRRAVNDEKLTSIALQIHGTSYDEEWLSEGRRLFGVLHHPMPITTYTRLADEIAQSIWKENKCLDSPDVIMKSESIKEITMYPPTNPQSSFTDELVNLSPATGPRSVVSSSNDVKPLFEELSEISKAGALSDSYVFLPSGTVVQLESKSTSEKTTYILPAPESDTSTGNNKKRQRTASLNEEDDNDYVIKKIYRPDDIKAHKEKHQLDLDCSQSVDLGSRSGTVISGYSENGHTLTSPTQHGACDISSKRAKLSERQVNLKTAVHCKLYEREPDSSEKLTFHSRNALSWATKHTVTTESKHKRKMQRSSKAVTAKFSGSSPGLSQRSNSLSSDKSYRTIAARDVPHYRYSSIAAEHIKLPCQHSMITSIQQRATIHRSSPDEQSLQFSDSLFIPGEEPVVSSPQRIFRPTLHMASNSSTVTKTNVSLQERPVPPTSPLLQCSVEAGLAPVSAIVSQQISSQADFTLNSSQASNIDQQSKSSSSLGKVKIVRPGNPKQIQPSKSFASISSQHNVFDSPGRSSLSAIRSSSQLSHQSGLTDISPPLCSPLRQTSIDSKRILHASSSASSHTVKSSFAPTTYVKNVKDLGNQGPPGARIRSPLHDSSSSLESIDISESVSAAASGLCALASTPIISGAIPTPAPTKTPVTNKAASTAVSSTGIIKVTPRPIYGAKGLPVVTQIAGTRITKTLSTGPGSAKPNIIVVHRQLGRNSVTTPAKFLEIEGPRKSVSRVKTLSSTNKSLTKSTTLIKPAPTKFLENPMSVPLVSSESAPLLTGLHKVVAKGKMRQLVLKPTSSGQHGTSLQSFRHPTLKQSTRREVPASQIIDSSREKGRASAPLHATSTMKALVAIQKSSPSLSSNSKLSPAPSIPGVMESRRFTASSSGIQSATESRSFSSTLPER